MASPDPLQRLIAARRDEDSDRYSYSAIARRGDLPRATVHALATRERAFKNPRPDTLKKLATGLELPLARVRAAAAEAAGYAVEAVDVAVDDDKSKRIEVIVVGLQQLSEQDLRRVQRIVHDFTDEPDEASAKVTETPPRRRGRRSSNRG